MKNDAKSTAIMLAALWIAMAMVVSAYIIYRSPQPSVINICPEINITCPNPEVRYTVNNSIQNDVAEPRRYSFIQNPRANITDISWKNSTFCLGADSWSILLGSSMNPVIFEGNMIILQNYNGDPASLHQGMIIRYKSEDGFTAHRIWGLYDNYLVTQGDNNDDTEEISYENITHIVIGVLFT